jgi:gliding motility-associated-like protein
MKTFITLILVTISLTGFGQAPIINEITPLSTYPGNTILITGSGFSNNPSQMQVWFDNVMGTVLSPSSEYSMEVTVPFQARHANIEVINLNSSSRLSAKFLKKFIPSYNGTTFDDTKFASAVSGVTSFPAVAGSEELFDVCTCDFDSDGKPDMAVSKTAPTGTDVTLLRNTSTPGNMSFVSTTFSTGTPTFNVVCGDINGDGKPELVASRGGVTRNEVFILRNTSAVGTISFAPLTRLFLDAGQFAFRMMIKDLNSDGKPDMVVSNSLTSPVSTVYVYTNQSSGGTLAFNAIPTKIEVTGATTTYGMEIQDLDGDKKPDLIFCQFNGSDIFIVKNASSVGQMSFPTIIRLPLAGSLNHLTTADFNEDGKSDIAVTSSVGDNKVFVLLNQSASGTISFSSAMMLTGGDWPWGIDAADIDGDRDVDIITGNLNNNNVTNEIVVHLNNGNNTSLAFARQSIQKGKKSRNLKVGDLDGDGKPDIAYTTVSGNSIDILRNQNCFTPSITNLVPLTICAGQTIQLKSIPSPGATFAWRESSNAPFKTSADPFANITAVGSYTVTATAEAGACVVQSAPINVTPSLGSAPTDPTINPVTPVCTGQTLNLTTPTVAGVTYIWTGPNSFTSAAQNPSIPSVTPASSGIYTLQLQAAAGTCRTNMATVRVDIVNLANFFVSSSVASNSVCQGGSLNLLVNTSAGHTYQWIKDGADIGGQVAGTLAVTQEGAYRVRVTNTALACSRETDPLTVTVLAMPVSNFTSSANTICINREMTFTNQSTFDSRGTPSYSWNFGDGGALSTLQNPSKTYTAAAARTVQLTVGYAGVTGCTNSSTRNITVAAPTVPVINATVGSICKGESTTLSVAGTFATYNWTGPTTGTTPTLNVSLVGDYEVSTTEANGCSSTSAKRSITRKEQVPITVTADGQTVDENEVVVAILGSTIQLSASGATTYAWSPSDGLDNPAIANPILTPTADLTYRVKGSTLNRCDSTRTFSIKAESAFKPPTAFSPNGDGQNEIWEVPGSESFANCTITIFHKQGGKVFEQLGYSTKWDGTFNGKQLPKGTYFYVLSCPDKKPETGHVMLVR